MANDGEKRAKCVRHKPETPITLHPLQFEEALDGLLRTPPKPPLKRTKPPAKTDTQPDN